MYNREGKGQARQNQLKKLFYQLQKMLYKGNVKNFSRNMDHMPLKESFTLVVHISGSAQVRALKSRVNASYAAPRKGCKCHIMG